MANSRKAIEVFHHDHVASYVIETLGMLQYAGFNHKLGKNWISSTNELAKQN